MSTSQLSSLSGNTIEKTHDSERARLCQIAIAPREINPLNGLLLTLENGQELDKPYFLSPTVFNVPQGAIRKDLKNWDLKLDADSMAALDEFILVNPELVKCPEFDHTRNAKEWTLPGRTTRLDMESRYRDSVVLTKYPHLADGVVNFKDSDH